MDVEVGTDRLSILPDELIHKILSFLNITEVIGNSALSSRWRYIWTSMPYLTFSTEDFTTLREFSKLVTHVLSRRNNLSEVHSVKLSFRGKASQVFVKRILNYAFSHNVQQLNVVCLHEKDIELPLYLFSSQTLKHLSLKMQSGKPHMHIVCSRCITPTSTWELPALTTLVLHSVTLCDDKADKCIDIFSKCVNLKNLTLKRFKTNGSDGFSISHPRLSNLTLENGSFDVKDVNVVAPQLENLTIRAGGIEHVTISAPALVSLLYSGYGSFHLSTDGLHCLEKANICVSRPQKADAHQIICLLQRLHNVHILTLNLEIVEILSSSADLIVHQPSPFVKLKSLKIYPKSTFCYEQAPKKVAMSNELKSYLLDGSSDSILTMVLREEIIAQKLLAELGVLLEKEKEDTSINGARLARGKAQVESHKPKKLKIGGNMAQIRSCWEDLGEQIQKRKEKACFIISKLECIEELLENLPASNRAKIQAWFSSLCAEADIVISNITDCMKSRCDESQSHFHELATALKTSS